MNIIRSIQNRIYEVRGERIMLEFDLADLYEVATKALNQTVKRVLLQQIDMEEQLKQIKERLGEHCAIKPDL